MVGSLHLLLDDVRTAIRVCLIGQADDTDWRDGASLDLSGMCGIPAVCCDESHHSRIGAKQLIDEDVQAVLGRDVDAENVVHKGWHHRWRTHVLRDMPERTKHVPGMKRCLSGSMKSTRSALRAEANRAPNSHLSTCTAAGLPADVGAASVDTLPTLAARERSSTHPLATRGEHVTRTLCLDGRSRRSCPQHTRRARLPAQLAAGPAVPGAAFLARIWLASLASGAYTIPIISFHLSNQTHEAHVEQCPFCVLSS